MPVRSLSLQLYLSSLCNFSILHSALKSPNDKNFPDLKISELRLPPCQNGISIPVDLTLKFHYIENDS